MPVFTTSNFPTKNVTWAQAIFGKALAKDSTGVKATYTVPTGKIFQILEVLSVSSAAGGTTVLEIKKGTNVIVMTGDLGSSTIVAVISRQTVAIASDVVQVDVTSAGGAGQTIDVIVSGQIADA